MARAAGQLNWTGAKNSKRSLMGWSDGCFSTVGQVFLKPKCQRKEDRAMSAWVSQSSLSDDSAFLDMHDHLPVSLIMTHRRDWATCTPEMSVSEIPEEHRIFSFLPVVDQNAKIIIDGQEFHATIGLFHQDRYAGKHEKIGDYYTPIGENNLIASNASILDYVLQAQDHQCCLIASGYHMRGLVSLSDLQQLPVRAALFGLVTGLEQLMIEVINNKQIGQKDWISLISAGRQKKVKDLISESLVEDAYVDPLLFTQLCDKFDIIQKAKVLELSKVAFNKKAKPIKKLRDDLAHANEFANSPKSAANTSETVNVIIEFRNELVSAMGSNT
ncbi:MAG: hypothetical protein ABJN69_06340 [Hellea sp.]